MRCRTALIVLLLQGCGGKHEAAPPLAGCGEQGCRPTIGSGRVQGTGGGGGLVTDAGDGMFLTVNAVAFDDSSTGSLAWSLSSVTRVSDVVSVQAPAADGAIVNETGNSPVVLEGVATGSYAWVSVAPTNANSIYLPTLTGLEGLKSATVDVPMLLNEDFAFVAGLFTRATLSLDSSSAQLALKIVNAEGNGVRNARIANPGGATVAYANSGVWIDASLDPLTDDSGRVTAINVPAPAVPGTFITVTAYGESPVGTQVKATRSLPIEAGFISYGTIRLDLS